MRCVSGWVLDDFVEKIPHAISLVFLSKVADGIYESVSDFPLF